MKKQRKVSIWRARATLSFRRSWTSWSLAKTQRRGVKEQLRLRLLQAMVDSQLLLVKELELREERLYQQAQELRASQLYRLKQEPLPPAPITDRELRELGR